MFTDECRATLDGPDGWSEGGSQMEATVPLVSDDNKVEVASCFVLGSLVMSWLAYGKFQKVWKWPLWHTLISWRSISNRGSNPNICHWKGKWFFCMAMPRHMQWRQRVTNYLQKIGFKDGRVMVPWPPFSPDLNPVENLRSMHHWEDGICFWTAIFNVNGVMGCHRSIHIHNCEQHFSRINSETNRFNG